MGASNRGAPRFVGQAEIFRCNSPLRLERRRQPPPRNAEPPTRSRVSPPNPLPEIAPGPARTSMSSRPATAPAPADPSRPASAGEPGADLSAGWA